MSNTSTAVHRGIDTTGLLGVAFVILKLTHVIDWSWWWVTAPFWMPLAIALVIVAIILILEAA